MLQTGPKLSSSNFLSHSSPCFTDQEHIIAMTFELVFSIASVTLMVVVLFFVVKMYLVLTGTHREDAEREEQERFNRGQREREEDRRNHAEERPRGFARRRLPVQHDERRCLGVSIRFINSFYDGLVLMTCPRSSVSLGDWYLKKDRAFRNYGHEHVLTTSSAGLNWYVFPSCFLL